MSVRPLVISGPSGAGKSTLMLKLMERHRETFKFCVSHTTRKARPGEKDGIHYYFVDTQTFEQHIQEKKFIEYVNFAGNYYGTSHKAVTDIMNSGQICILDVDRRGVVSIKNFQLDPSPRFVFIYPSDTNELKSRLEKRGTEDKEKIEQRFSSAKSDIDFALNGDGSKIYDKLIKNDKIEDALKELEELLEEDIKLVEKH